MSSPSSFNFQEFVNGYVTAMLWSSNDESDEAGGVPLDNNHSREDIPSEDMKAIEADCRRFSRYQAVLLDQAVRRNGYDSARAGHDFWLTREGHGAGFWDRNELEAGDLGTVLSEAARAFGQHVEGGPWVEEGKVRYGRSKDEVEEQEAQRDPRRAPAVEAVIAVLPAALGEALDCVRVWSAWSYGTMHEDDFVQVRDDAERLHEIATAVVDARRHVKDPITPEAIEVAVGEALAESLGEAYDCTASWDAWGDGTMGPDNFKLVAETDDRFTELLQVVNQALVAPFSPEPSVTPSDRPRRRLR